MQIGVDPVAVAALIRLRRVMRAVPIAARVQPKRLEPKAQCRRRLGSGERGPEGGKIHALSYLVSLQASLSAKALISAAKP